MNFTPDELAEQFLNKMREKTGVSWRFLNSARPLVRRAFIEVPLERREACLASLAKAFSRQAEIESLAAEAKRNLGNAREQILATHNLFGPLKKNKPMVN